MSDPPRQAPVVTGEIRIGAGVPPFSRGTAHVWLEDVSRAGGEAEPLLEAVIPGLAHPQSGESPGATEGGETRVPFVLEGGAAWPGPDPRRDYAVRVEVETGSGPEGALYSQERSAVLTRGHGSRVSVRVEGTPRG